MLLHYSRVFLAFVKMFPIVVGQRLTRLMTRLPLPPTVFIAARLTSTRRSIVIHN